jgi:hypothetical protein
VSVDPGEMTSQVFASNLNLVRVPGSVAGGVEQGVLTYTSTELSGEEGLADAVAATFAPGPARG